MDVNDLAKEVASLRERNHKLSNLVTMHTAQLDNLNKIEKDISEIKIFMDSISASLSGGLSGSGIINRVEVLERNSLRVAYWLKVVGATLLTLAAKTAYTSIFVEPMFSDRGDSRKMMRPEDPPAVIRREDE